jgi:hypothetical protein
MVYLRNISVDTLHKGETEDNNNNNNNNNKRNVEPRNEMRFLSYRMSHQQFRLWKGKLRNILQHVETADGATVWDEGPRRAVSCHIQRLLGKVSLQRVRRHALGSCSFGTVKFCQRK